jgi:Lon protease-like protein
MRAGNMSYVKASDIPDTIAVFPLTGALLLPGGQLPLNIFEPRYLEMIDHALTTNRLIGMVQPSLDGKEKSLCNVGCIGRIAAYGESGDGRYHITLAGVCRYRVIEELSVKTPWRQVSLTPFLGDLETPNGEGVNRDALIKTFRAYLQSNELEADWESVNRADNAMLVNALSMMSPFGPAEKQALLEAADLKSRAETLVAITEIMLARNGEMGSTLQ